MIETWLNLFGLLLTGLGAFVAARSVFEGTSQIAKRHLLEQQRSTARRAPCPKPNGNPFAALGPHDTRAGRIIRAFLPSTTKVELLRRPDGASRLAFALGQGLPQPAHDLAGPDECERQVVNVARPHGSSSL
jgi:hypothetical protein